MDKPSTIWHCIEASTEAGLRELVWKGVLKEQFAWAQPYIVLTDKPAVVYPCRRFLMGGGCQYRILEKFGGGYMGHCEEDFCEPRDFTLEELLLYRADVLKVLREVAHLLDIPAAPKMETQDLNLWILSNVTLPNGSSLSVYFLRVYSHESFHSQVLKLLAQHDEPFILTAPTNRRCNAETAALLNRRGCPFIALDEYAELGAKGLANVPETKQHFVDLLNRIKSKIDPSHANMVGEAMAQPYVRAIERGFASIGKDLKDLKDENIRLKDQLSQQLANIAREVEPEYFHWVLTILGMGSASSAAKALGIANSSFDEKLKRYREKSDTHKLIYELFDVRRRAFGKTKLVHFENASILQQPENLREANIDLLNDVIEALEAQNESNWPSIRDELLVILQDII